MRDLVCQHRKYDVTSADDENGDYFLALKKTQGKHFWLERIKNESTINCNGKRTITTHTVKRPGQNETRIESWKSGKHRRSGRFYSGWSAMLLMFCFPSCVVCFCSQFSDVIVVHFYCQWCSSCHSCRAIGVVFFFVIVFVVWWQCCYHCLTFV